MEDDLFDNGIDGEPFESYADHYYEDVEEFGGMYLYDEDNAQIIYFYGQWNDSGVDPDRILVKCGLDNYNNATHYVYIDQNKLWVTVPGKSFDLPISTKLSDFVEIDPPVFDLIPMRTGISELREALDEKKVKFIFNEEKFKAKLERYKNLLAFT